ncbi:SPFH domain-containing protein [Pelotalea chapellei]|uniref:SPFH domain-containing protein n=1 Tax=Pelotalea chapellei TaxID=44671 RepID=A0ABS5UCU9_9BACT|nr:SPFH domain-containing protein [Pelotalea chapellei]MBT1073461.1 SPFH domain-containing protein [Pelotalea chapellei]
MTLWQEIKAEFIDIIEWIDESNDTLAWRFPRYENEIKQGAQLIVRQSQAAVFVDQGKIADVFSPGRHELATRNLPVLSTLRGWKYLFDSPFKAEVYFVNTKNFTNLKWGTKNPVMLRDSEFGPVRLRSYGTYVVRVVDPARFVREIVGTGAHFTLEGICDQLKNLIVTRFSDLLGESGISVLDLAANYDELSARLKDKIAPEFLEYGLDVTKLLVENISLPIEVEEALDKRTSIGVIGNLDNFVKFQGANAMEMAAKNPGGDASAGVGMGIGFAMANQMGKVMAPPPVEPQGSSPPTLPPGAAAVNYFVGKNGKQAGPFDETAVAAYIGKGAITEETLMWKAGMEGWEAAGKFPEFVLLFDSNPPPLPQ